MKPTFKKVLSFAALLLLIPSIYGIDLQSKIPKNALYVFTINGQNILTKMPLAELEKLTAINDLTKQMLKGVPGGSKLSDLGVNIGATSYFFVEVSDSIIYFTYMFPLSDAKKFENILGKKRDVVKDANGNMMVSDKDMVIAWNKEYAMIVAGEIQSDFFSKHPETYSYYGFEGTQSTADTTKIMTDDESNKYYNQENVEAPYPADTVAVDYTISEADTIAVSPDGDYTTYNDNNYVDDWSVKYDQRKKIGEIWKQKKSAEIFSLTPAQSLTTNEKFMKSQDKTAEAVSWLGSSQGVLYDMVNKFYQNAFRYSSYSKSQTNLDPNSPLLSAENYMASTVRFNTNNIKVDLTTGLDSRLMVDYAKMTDSKYNKKFFNYIPSEDLLGYYSLGYNTQGMLEAMPNLMKPYLQMMPYTGDISSEIMDIYALFIDEAALGRLVKGDGVFAVTGLKEKEVPYTTYEYDSLYNYKEITSTKKETLPEFVVMFSTEDAITMDKIFSIAFKKGGLIKIAENHYEVIKMRNMPFTISIIQKDGIVFICNSKEQVEIIMKGKVKKPLSAEIQKSMSTNSLNFYVDLKKIFSLIPEEPKSKSKDDYVSRDTKMLDYCRKNVGQISLTQAKAEGNEIHTELVISVPNNSQNSLKYFFNFVNDLYKIEKR